MCVEKRGWRAPCLWRHERRGGLSKKARVEHGVRTWTDACEAARRRRRTTLPASPGGPGCPSARGLVVKSSKRKALFGICARRAGASEWERSMGRADRRAPSDLHLPSLRSESRQRAPCAAVEEESWEHGEEGDPYRLGVSAAG